MELLTGNDYRSMVDVMAALRHTGGREELARELIPLLASLIGSDITSYNEVNPIARTVSGVIHPDEFDIDRLVEALERHMDDHPVISHHRKTGDNSAQKISDIISQRELHDTGLYQELYRKLGVEYQISIIIPSRKPIIAALVFNRRNSDFSRRDQAILNILRPHLTRAFESARLVSRLRKDLVRHQGLLENLPDGVALLNGHSRVEIWTDKARLWMGKYFPGANRSTSVLPAEITDWLRREGYASESPMAGPTQPMLTKYRGEDHLIVRLVGISKKSRMLVLTEVRPSQSAKPLEALGLSPRQAEALLHLAQGHSDDEIARRLSISPRTVQKHLESVFKVLKVSSRITACRLAWDRLRILLLPLLLTGWVAFELINTVC